MFERLRYSLSTKNPYQLCKPGSSLRGAFRFLLLFLLLCLVVFVGCPITGRQVAIIFKSSNCSNALVNDCICFGRARPDNLASTVLCGVMGFLFYATFFSAIMMTFTLYGILQPVVEEINHAFYPELVTTEEVLPESDSSDQ